MSSFFSLRRCEKQKEQQFVDEKQTEQKSNYTKRNETSSSTSTSAMTTRHSFFRWLIYNKQCRNNFVKTTDRNTIRYVDYDYRAMRDARNVYTAILTIQTFSKMARTFFRRRWSGSRNVVVSGIWEIFGSGFSLNIHHTRVEARAQPPGIETKQKNVSHMSRWHAVLLSDGVATACRANEPIVGGVETCGKPLIYLFATAKN